MKTKHFFLSTLLILLMSCNEKETNITYDFSVLGLEKITIDETEITLDSFGIPEINSDSFLILGSNNGSPTRSYNLVIWNNEPTEQNISIKSKYDDTLTTIEKNTDSRSFNITISRKGFSEKIVYNIGFMKLESK